MIASALLPVITGQMVGVDDDFFRFKLFSGRICTPPLAVSLKRDERKDGTASKKRTLRLELISAPYTLKETCLSKEMFLVVRANACSCYCCFGVGIAIGIGIETPIESDTDTDPE